MIRWLFIFLTIAVFVLAILLLGKNEVASLKPWVSASPTSSEARRYEVTYHDGVFSPTHLRIRQGDSVLFKNEGSAAIALTGEHLELGAIASGQSSAHIFVEAGVFTYHNAYHETESGTITVEP